MVTVSQVMTDLKLLASQAGDPKQLASQFGKAFTYYWKFKLDGTPRVHVRRNGSRYIYPEALFASEEFRQEMGLGNTKSNQK